MRSPRSVALPVRTDMPGMMCIRLARSSESSSRPRRPSAGRIQIDTLLVSMRRSVSLPSFVCFDLVPWVLPAAVTAFLACDLPASRGASLAPSMSPPRMYCTSSRSTSSRRISGLSRAPRMSPSRPKICGVDTRKRPIAPNVSAICCGARSASGSKWGLVISSNRPRSVTSVPESLHLVGPHVARLQEHPAAVVEGVELDDQRAQLGLACRHPQATIAELVADAVSGLQAGGGGDRRDAVRRAHLRRHVRLDPRPAVGVLLLEARLVGGGQAAHQLVGEPRLAGRDRPVEDAVRQQGAGLAFEVPRVAHGQHLEHLAAPHLVEQVGVGQLGEEAVHVTERVEALHGGLEEALAVALATRSGGAGAAELEQAAEQLDGLRSAQALTDRGIDLLDRRRGVGRELVDGLGVEGAGPLADAAVAALEHVLGRDVVLEALEPLAVVEALPALLGVERQAAHEEVGEARLAVADAPVEQAVRQELLDQGEVARRLAGGEHEQQLRRGRPLRRSLLIRQRSEQAGDRPLALEHPDGVAEAVAGVGGVEGRRRLGVGPVARGSVGALRRRRPSSPAPASGPTRRAGRWRRGRSSRRDRRAWR